MTPTTNEKNWTFVEHLEELRKRLWICIFSVLFFSVVGFCFASRVVEWLKRPAGETLPRLAFFSPAEALLAYVKVAFSVGIILSMPLLLYELWVFVRPGLTPQERRVGIPFVLWGTALFAAGGSFAYWVLLPASFRFLLTFAEGTLEPVISISHYLSFTLGVILVCGITFELPVAVFFLTQLGLLTPALLRRNWKTAFLGILIAAAVLTPTQDAFTMAFMAVPLLVLYGISVIVSGWALPKQT